MNRYGARRAAHAGVGLALIVGLVSPPAAAALAVPTPNATSVSIATSAAVGLDHATRIGSVPDAQQLTVAVSLKLRNTDALDSFIRQVSDPHSPQYGHYLTPAQFLAAYGPTSADVDRVSGYLKDAGLTITAISSNRQVVDAIGRVGQIRTAFGTTIGRYVDDRDHRAFYANDTAPTLPSEIAAVVQGVAGLDDHAVRHHGAVTARMPVTPHSGPLGGYTPSELRSAYAINSLSTGGIDGTGISVGVWEFDGFQQANIDKYDSQYGLSSPAPSTRSVDGANYNSSPGEGQNEVELDIEVIRAVASKATQTVYEAPNTDAGEIDMANAVAGDDSISVLSISWGECEQDRAAGNMTSVDNAFKQAAAEGISIFAASGDDGSKDCTRSASGNGVVAVDFPSSDPYVSGVGGTSLITWGGSYILEATWSGTGGGNSTVFAKPSWQAGTGTMRTVPDVASNADPLTGYSVYSGGFWTALGGTSAAAPMWAGFAALYDQKASTKGKPKLGYANPALYSVGGSSSYASAFHDITGGSNGDYSAGAGYDRTTGWGSYQADGLATALLGRDTLPSNDFVKSMTLP
jgi:kumamolisin